MLVQGYHIRRSKDGSVVITPISRGAKGRPYRNTFARREYPSLKEGLEGMADMAGRVKLFGL